MDRPRGISQGKWNPAPSPVAAAPPAGGSQADPLIAGAPWRGALFSLDTQQTPAEGPSSHGLQEPEVSSSGVDTVFPQG